MADTSVHLAVSWKKDNIDLARAGERVYQDSNNTLVLNNITFEDSGEFSVSVISRLPSSCQDHQFLLNNMQYNSIFIHWLFWGNVFNLTLAQKSTNLWILSRWILLSELSGYFEFICANGCHEIVFSGFRSLSSPAVKGNGQKSNADHWISNSLPVYERRRVPPPHPQSLP